jgi:hypothetical protein
MTRHRNDLLIAATRQLERPERADALVTIVALVIVAAYVLAAYVDQMGAF